MKYNPTIKNQGQVVLIVLLSLSVVLIIAMYIMSRSVSDISFSSKDENAMRAFSAAEAGVERALIAGSTGTLSIGDASFNAAVAEYGLGETEIVYPVALKSGEVAVFWFVEHDENGNLVCSSQRPCFAGNTLRLCWGEPGTEADSSQTPAVEISFYYTSSPLDFSRVFVARGAYDPNSSRILTTDAFSSADVSSCHLADQEFAFKKDINLFSDFHISNTTTQGILLYATVKPLYNLLASQKIGLGGTDVISPFPSQGKMVDSTGVYNESNRRINVYQMHPAVPDIFSNVIYTAGGIVK